MPPGKPHEPAEEMCAVVIGAVLSVHMLHQKDCIINEVMTDCDVAYNVSYECNFTYIFVHGSETMLIQGIVFGFVNTVVQVQSSWILF